ncbi:MAG TPA: response regulator [Gemmatimonadales bacterium]|jgi:DNA-binding NtrC family response regulator
MTGRVLVVDDEPALRQALERALRSFGYEVASAADPQSAYILLAEAPFDAILLDLRLKHTMGDAFYLALVRQWPYLRDRVILMSGDPWSIQEGWPPELLACPVLAKPFTLQSLSNLLAQIVSPGIRKQNGGA